MHRDPTQSSLVGSLDTPDPGGSAFDDELDAKYEYARLLGKGGMGRVVLARHRKLDEWVAIKLLHPELSTAEFLSRFKREARASIRVRSPHVARVMDVAELSNGIPYIVMEYLEGRDLAQWIASRGRLPAPQAIDFLIQALDAVGEAHDRGIVHRDLKPANLFVTRDREGRDFVKVLDFGLAKSATGIDSATYVVTEPGSLVGSPCYMPPEQLLDAQSADARSDVWALGATLFELLTGQPPFQGPTMPQLYTAIVHGRIRPPTELVPDLPPALEAVIVKCLTRDPAGRYENGWALRDALAELAQTESDAKDRAVPLTASEPDPAVDLSAFPTSVISVVAPAPVDSRLSGLVRPLFSRRSLTGLAALLLVLLGVVWTRGVPRESALSPAIRARATQASRPEPPRERTAPLPSLEPPSPTSPQETTSARSIGRDESRGTRAARPKPAAVTSASPGQAPAPREPREPPSIYDRYP